MKPFLYTDTEIDLLSRLQAIDRLSRCFPMPCSFSCIIISALIPSSPIALLFLSFLTACSSSSFRMSSSCLCVDICSWGSFCRLYRFSQYFFLDFCVCQCSHIRLDPWLINKSRISGTHFRTKLRAINLIIDVN